jgi:hypothetical protein
MTPPPSVLFLPVTSVTQFPAPVNVVGSFGAARELPGAGEGNARFLTEVMNNNGALGYLQFNEAHRREER